MSDFVNRKYVTIQIILTHTNNLEWTLNLNILVKAEISPKEKCKWHKVGKANSCRDMFVFAKQRALGIGRHFCIWPLP